ncbi:hypothetical protein L198_03719 [Cryptococcus wingfieldii CBS 7118]|uniref:Uncharacterized protein n=1 Tax=Cryptococcus wingfieldii CBS 7118 TaxID=1295528 RepID=A0A1E3JCA3_9TREE|nr:hypothetical protein L198_03719 [Cryptococcus wingfieldii CBS 7118]ODN98474.1 hypothetical protein L198_03719 [Cryptococcus wingfieldii CBS 7118]
MPPVCKPLPQASLVYITPSPATYLPLPTPRNEPQSHSPSGRQIMSFMGDELRKTKAAWNNVEYPAMFEPSEPELLSCTAEVCFVLRSEGFCGSRMVVALPMKLQALILLDPVARRIPFLPHVVACAPGNALAMSIPPVPNSTPAPARQSVIRGLAIVLVDICVVLQSSPCADILFSEQGAVASTWSFCRWSEKRSYKIHLGLSLFPSLARVSLVRVNRTPIPSATQLSFAPLHLSSTTFFPCSHPIPTVADTLIATPRSSLPQQQTRPYSDSTSAPPKFELASACCRMGCVVGGL